MLIKKMNKNFLKLIDCTLKENLINIKKSTIFTSSKVLNFNEDRNESLAKSFKIEKLNKKDFDNHFVKVVDELTKLNSNLKQVSTWYKEVLNYNMLGGKKIRPLTFLNAYQTISDHQKKPILNESVYSLAWAIELLQVFFLIADDIMDHSITRRSSLCWYKKEEVGLIAINDCFFLEQGIYQLVRNFKNHKNYVDIVDLFLETTQKTVYGQSLDLLVSPTGQKVDLNKFDIDRYLTIAKYKTSFYSCSLPIRLAFYLCEVDKEDLHLKIEDLMSKVGIFLQMQDDYLDAFGDPKVIGKIGTDIQDGKCCWPIVMSLKLATNDQKEILYENYGIDNEDCIQKVKEVYKELNIEKLFKDHEEQLYKELMVLFNRICEQTNLPESIFKFQVDNLYKRNH